MLGRDVIHRRESTGIWLESLRKVLFVVSLNKNL